jgi:hypothetical protein
MNRLSLLLAATLASFIATIHPCSSQTDAPTADEVKAVAEEAYIYGLPLVMAYTASYDPSILPPGEGTWSPPALVKVK